MTTRPVTVEDLKGSVMQTTLHMRLARGGNCLEKQSVTWPRLRQVASRAHRSAPNIRKTYVDKLECRTLDDVAAALNRTEEENNAMQDGQERQREIEAEQLRLGGGAGQPKWTLAHGIAECKRELHMRGRVYRRLVDRGELTQIEADRQIRHLQGTQRFLEFCAKHEPRLREIVEGFMASEQERAA